MIRPAERVSKMQGCGAGGFAPRSRIWRRRELPPWAPALFFYERDHQQGLALLKKAIELQPSYAIAHQIYGTFLLILGRFDEAIAPLERSVHLDPLSLRTNRTLGYCFYLMGRLKEAEHWIKAALAVRPDAAESHYFLARVYLREDRLDKALSAARECDRSDTASPSAIHVSASWESSSRAAATPPARWISSGAWRKCHPPDTSIR